MVVLRQKSFLNLIGMQTIFMILFTIFFFLCFLLLYLVVVGMPWIILLAVKKIKNSVSFNKIQIFFMIAMAILAFIKSATRIPLIDYGFKESGEAIKLDILFLSLINIILLAISLILPFLLAKYKINKKIE
jgi:hypothetical protein